MCHMCKVEKCVNAQLDPSGKNHPRWRLQTRLCSSPSFESYGNLRERTRSRHHRSLGMDPSSLTFIHLASSAIIHLSQISTPTSHFQSNHILRSYPADIYPLCHTNKLPQVTQSHTSLCPSKTFVPSVSNIAHILV